MSILRCPAVGASGHGAWIGEGTSRRAISDRIGTEKKDLKLQLNTYLETCAASFGIILRICRAILCCNASDTACLASYDCLSRSQHVVHGMPIFSTDPLRQFMPWPPTCNRADSYRQSFELPPSRGPCLALRALDPIGTDGKILP